MSSFIDRLLDPKDIRPRSLEECRDSNGNIITEKEALYNEFYYDLMTTIDDTTNLGAEQQESTRKQVKRRRKTSKMQKLDEYGNLMDYLAQETPWYINYILFPKPTNESFCKKFRRRFHLPYKELLNLATLSIEENWFLRWDRPNSAGKPSSPIELMILGALCYLGRGWTFDDLEESTAISQETHHQFFHEFICIGSTQMYDLFVKSKSDPESVVINCREYKNAGCHGAIGSTDATHILLEHCSWQLRNNL